ncbi:Acyl-CoA synthetase (AMP-forming)/AMP-acid ligase II [Micromonospora mirobrigensis]|uniref:Acyl-CoA synthetase (AMP-forming)/AMP-acid ligase II n=1 Tax=Micromonospora mirobrigensis TaxID=262898 RepID=A0A1C4WZ15_9ACTN|nr:Acyl-CoA synthetase (AMP-forming)/AMP-acid ligase II [Micromonospora mirobrigensis]
MYLDHGRERRQTYGELLDAARRVLTGLRRGGVRPGDKVILQIDDDRDLLSTFWACVLGGFVPAPTTPRPPVDTRLSPEAWLARVWDALDRPWVVTGSAVEPDVSIVDSWLGAAPALAHNAAATHLRRARSDDIATLLLTSGSTGAPKAVMLSHHNIISRSTATIQVRQLSWASRTFNWMPLDHVGGLVMFHVRDTLLGCHQVHARTGWILAEPLRWLDLISEHECDTTWAPNFAFNLIVDRENELRGRPWNLSRLRYIMNGGESIKARTAHRLLALLAPYGLPATAMHPGWGMSETSSGVVDAVFDPDTQPADGRYVPVGAPHPGVRLRVVDDEGNVVPQGVSGRLEVSGAPITSGYYGDPPGNPQSFTPDGWFKTGDLAVIRDGSLTVTGRADDVLEIDGIRYHGHEIEAAVEELPFVEPSYTVACPVEGERGERTALVVFFHPRSGVAGDGERAQISELVRVRFGLPVARVAPVAREDVPKTGVGKLRRARMLESLPRDVS